MPEHSRGKFLSEGEYLSFQVLRKKIFVHDVDGPKLVSVPFFAFFRVLVAQYTDPRNERKIGLSVLNRDTNHRGIDNTQGDDQMSVEILNPFGWLHNGAEVMEGFNEGKDES
jgi:hypothetical protein